MVDEPTLSEVMRQVERLVQQVRDMVQEVRSDYVRKDLYDARHTGLTRRVDDLESEAAEQERDRKSFQRQIVGGIIIGVILMLANLAVTALVVAGRGA